MHEARRFNYEGMFLFGQAAAADFGGCIDHIREILGRHGAEIIAMRKWDERRLAYEIKKNKRGLYILVFFNCDGSQMSGIERDCNLSERVLRTMVLRADHLTVEEMQAADGQQALADEAKLRKERGVGPGGEQMEEPAGVGSDEDGM